MSHCLSDQQCHADVLISAFTANYLGGSTCGTVSFGLLRTPDQFTKQALLLDHPFANMAADDAIKASVAKTLSEGVDATRRRWRDLLLFWKSRAAKLEQKEAELHEARPIRHVLKGKRILVLRELLLDSGFPTQRR